MSVFVMSFIILSLCVFIPGRMKVGTIGAVRTATVDIKTPLLFILLGTLAAFRDASVGNDTHEYLNIFNDVRRASVSELPAFGGRFEMGYIWLNKLVSYVSTNPQVILIVTSVFAYYWYGRFIKEYSPMVGVSVLIFFFGRFHDDSMNIVRQTAAAGFCLWGYMELKRRKNLMFFLLMLAAFYMHKSSIVFLLAWLFTRIPFRISYLKYFLPVWAFTFLAGNALVGLIFSTGLVQSYFLDSAFLEEGKSAPALILLIDAVVSLFYFLFSRQKVNIGKDDISSDIAWMLLASLLFQTLCLYFSLLVRVSWYFRLFELIAIPYALCRMKARSRVIYTVLVVAFFMLYYGIVLYYRPLWNHVYPYVTCFH